MSYKSASIEVLRSLLFTLYIHSLCASRRAELARGQRRCAVLFVKDPSKKVGMSQYTKAVKLGRKV